MQHIKQRLLSVQEAPVFTTKNESSQFLLEMNPLKIQIIVKWLHIDEDLMT
jgi:hypothetical protein